MKLKSLVGSSLVAVSLTFSCLTYNVAATLLQDTQTSTETSPKTEEPKPQPRTFTATAYALRGRTATGTRTRRGIIAADRRVLPMGTRVRIETPQGHVGEYVVADTGGAVKGNIVDIWVPSNAEAMRFGRRNVKLTVLSRPRAAQPAKKKKSR